MSIEDNLKALEERLLREEVQALQEELAAAEAEIMRLRAQVAQPMQPVPMPYPAPSYPQIYCSTCGMTVSGLAQHSCTGTNPTWYTTYTSGLSSMSSGTAQVGFTGNFNP